MPDGRKSIFTSKTFWTNIVALVGMIVQGATGSQLLAPIETQASILAIINVILRTVTKDPVSWS